MFLKKIKNLNQYILGNSDDFPLESRILNGTCFIGIILGFIGETFDLFYSFPMILHVIMLFFTLCFLLSFYLVRFKKKPKYITVFLFLISLSLLTVEWYCTEGIVGSSPILFLFTAVILLSLFDNLARSVVIFILLSVFSFLFLIQIYYPDSVLKYSSFGFQAFDIYFTIVFSIVTLSYFVNLLKSAFEKEREIVESQKNELQIKSQELLEAYEQMRELNETKERLYSIIAHDLRSPFTAMIGFSELILSDLNENDINESKRFAEYIRLTGTNTLTLLDNLLVWTKSQTGQLVRQSEKLLLNTLIEDVLQVIRPTAKIKNINVVHEVSEEIYVTADKNMLQTILRNLISNGIKFTKPDGEVRISFHSSESKVTVSIADNGTGMSETEITSLFVQGNHHNLKGTAGEKGSGLGLLLCKDFIEKHEGKIWVTSELGKGSTFHFTMPLG